MELEEREKFQDSYYSLMSKATILTSSNQIEYSQAPSVTSASQSRAKPFIKLSIISLPSFDGSYTSWRSFRDSFITLIHVNNELNGVKKLSYLKSALKGKPRT